MGNILVMRNVAVSAVRIKMQFMSSGKDDHWAPSAVRNEDGACINCEG